MQALGIVEGFDVIEEHGTGLGAIFRDSILEAFGFERGEKAFHGRVIVATALAAHTRGDVVDFKRVTEFMAAYQRRDRNEPLSKRQSDGWLESKCDEQESSRLAANSNIDRLVAR